MGKNQPNSMRSKRLHHGQYVEAYSVRHFDQQIFSVVTDGEKFSRFPVVESGMRKHHFPGWVDREWDVVCSQVRLELSGGLSKPLGSVFGVAFILVCESCGMLHT